MKSTWIAAIALVLGLPATLAAQRMEGRIVERGSGAPIEGAVVEMEAPASFSTITDSRGRWSFDDAGDGPFRIRVRHIGFGEMLIPAARPLESPLIIELSPEALPLDAVVVTASRRDQRLADAPVTTQVISRADIERTGVSDLSLVLMEQAGMQLEGGHPAGESVMLQGLGSERVLVLLDGQPLVGRISGQIDLSRIPTSMVERVEVLKGPQSSMYGSEAMGGVVNVITRAMDGGPAQIGVSVTGGSQGRIDAATSLRGSVGGVRYLVDAGRRLTELTPGQSRENGALARRWDGMAKLGWMPSQFWSLEVQGVRLEERQRWQSGQLFNFADNRQTGGRLSANWSRGSRRLSTTAYLSQFDHLSRRATSPDPAPGTGSTEVQRLMELESVLNTRVAGAALDLGIEGRRESTVSDRVIGRSRTLHSLEPFAQATLSAGPVQLTPGARYAWSEEWGGHFTPRLAMLLRPVESLGLRAAIGRGYRVPAFKELYMEFLNVGDGYGYTVRGNPELAPETSTNLTAGIEWSAGPAFVRAQAFRNRFDGFIETRLVGDSTGITVYSYGNIAEGETRGIESEVGWVGGPVRLEGGYSLLDTRESESGDALLGRARHTGRLTADARVMGPARLGVTAAYTGRAPVQRDEDGLVYRDGYLRVDARLGLTLPIGLDATIGARNLFDVQPELWPGFTGRHLYISLGWDVPMPGDR